jgi:peptidoglycan hydrolase-like protein with peptidoglycan-binding domain
MAFDETKHARGTGAQGGQFVVKGDRGSSTSAARIGFDGKRGAGYGTKGGDANVKALQRQLNRLGITDSTGKALTVDGKFGPKTTAAVKRLQRKLGLPADGKVSVALLDRIKKIKKTTRLTEPDAKKTAAPAKKTATPARDGKAAPR